MCLGVPGKITEMYSANGLSMGKIDFGGVIQEACLVYVPEAQVGNYALIHVGFAINLLDEEEAQATLELLKQLGEFESATDQNSEVGHPASQRQEPSQTDDVGSK